jgi:hypothetical protein
LRGKDAVLRDYVFFFADFGIYCKQNKGKKQRSKNQCEEVADE